MRTLIPVAVLLVLAVPATAAAKNLEATVCGASGCAVIPAGAASRLTVDLGDRTPGGPPPAPYYRVDFRDVDGGNSFSQVYVPSERRMAAGGDAPKTIAWFTVGAAQSTALDDAIGDLEPYPAPVVWPSSIDDSMLRRQPQDGERDWGPLGIAAALVLLALVFAVALRRLRVRRPSVT